MYQINIWTQGYIPCTFDTKVDCVVAIKQLLYEKLYYTTVPSCIPVCNCKGNVSNHTTVHFLDTQLKFLLMIESVLPLGTKSFAILCTPLFVSLIHFLILEVGTDKMSPISSRQTAMASLPL